MLQQAARIELRNVARGKYFRIVAEVFADGVNVAAALLEAGHAVSYTGKGPKHKWC